MKILLIRIANLSYEFVMMIHNCSDPVVLQIANEIKGSFRKPYLIR